MLVRDVLVVKGSRAVSSDATNSNATGAKGAIPANVIDRAITWHLRQADMSDDDWIMFVAWLEADPIHAAAYDRVAISDRAISRTDALPARPDRRAANDDHPAFRRWVWGAGGAAVAAGIALMIVPSLMSPRAAPYEISTAPGQRQQIALADGTRIDLSGGSRLTLDRNNLRVAALDVGEATFTVHHDAGTQFTVRSGRLSVQDVGTVFNVVRSGPRLDVQVAEGSVVFQPDGERIVLKPGNALIAREDDRKVTMGTVDADMVGGWRKGRLAFSGEPLSQVFEALNRLYGTNVTLTGDLSAQPFTGMIETTGRAARDIPHLADLIGVEWRRNGETWILSRRSAAAR
ncbi:FecR domain-containing protein [Sphingomonas aliaeris]|uniref:FecR domain-containing protein n=1 Tax=Sphingomonas aliaeris TaxID=2759526 RepID=A0A974NY27_9SPHN|nr:FecR domain-containing protein [Sphingomonas aliaeris]